MYPHISKALILFENGEKQKAIQLLEDYIKNNSSVGDEVIQSHEQILRFKEEMHIDATENILFLSQCEAEELFGDSLLSIAVYYKKHNNSEKAVEYLSIFNESVSDPEQYAEICGYSNEWAEICGPLTETRDVDDMVLYKKCEYGEKINELTDNEKVFILCENFVESINSGGFEEYFSSAFSRYCVDTVDMLHSMGSKDYTKALEKAISLFPTDFDFSDEQITEDYIDEHEKIQDKFEKIEEKIYDSNEDIEFLLQSLKEKINDK